MTDAILLKQVNPQELTETILKGVETQINELKKNIFAERTRRFFNPYGGGETSKN